MWASQMLVYWHLGFLELYSWLVFLFIFLLCKNRFFSRLANLRCEELFYAVNLQLVLLGVHAHVITRYLAGLR